MKVCQSNQYGKGWTTSSSVFFIRFWNKKPRHNNVIPTTLANYGVYTLNSALLSPPSERSEWRRYYFYSMCLCTVDRSIIAPKRLKLRTSNLTSMFPGTVRTWPLKIFRIRGVARVTWPQNVWMHFPSVPLVFTGLGWAKWIFAGI